MGVRCAAPQLSSLPHHRSGVRVHLQDMFWPSCEVLDLDKLKLGLRRHVGGKIPTDEGDNFGNTWMSEELPRNLVANHSRCTDDKNLHIDSNSKLETVISNCRRKSAY